MSLQPNQKGRKGNCSREWEEAAPNGHRDGPVPIKPGSLPWAKSKQTPKRRNRYSSVPSPAQGLGAASLPPGNLPRSPSMG